MRAAYRRATPISPSGSRQARFTRGDEGDARAVREQFKAGVLAVQYGMGQTCSPSGSAGLCRTAESCLRLHRELYRGFWRWSDARRITRCSAGLCTPSSAGRCIPRNPKALSLRNFPMQANGAEMLRLACIYATEPGLRVCAPVHDAILIEAPPRRGARRRGSRTRSGLWPTRAIPCWVIPPTLGREADPLP